MKNLIRKDNTAWRVIEGQAFIINTKTSTLHELDETGTFIWKLIEKGKTAGDIATELCSHYEVSEEQALKDTREFVEGLEKKGLIEKISV